MRKLSFLQVGLGFPNQVTLGNYHWPLCVCLLCSFPFDLIQFFVYFFISLLVKFLHFSFLVLCLSFLTLSNIFFDNTCH